MNPKTILVVEDEPLVGMELEEGLKRLGYRVPEVVTNGDEVEAAVERVRPDLILMDIRIKGSLDGIQAAAKIRVNSDVPVLFLTAYSDTQTIARAAEILPDGYLLKPFGERELAANVELALFKAKSPLRREKSLKKLLPLIEALDSPLCLFNREGEWTHANANARAFLSISESIAGQNGPPLTEFVTTDPDSFLERAAQWAGKEFTNRLGTFSYEVLYDRSGQIQGFLGMFAAMGKKEREHLTDSATAVNQTIGKLLPENGMFEDRIESAGFLIPSPSGTGDFYDLFPLGPRHFVFYDLDVMGHGPLPAMVAFSLRSAIRDLAKSYLRRHDSVPPPSELLEALNRKFAPRADDGLYFTISLGLIVPSTGDFSLCRAGHTHSVWMKANGSISLLKGSGTALGAFPEVKLEEIRGKLDRGDRLILFSDGVLEALGKKDLEAGYKVLSQELGRHAESSTAEMVGALKAQCSQSTGSTSDDLSLLALGPKFEHAQRF